MFELRPQSIAGFPIADGSRASRPLSGRGKLTFLAPLLSLLIPGLGQFVLGFRRRGLWMMIVALGLIATGFAFAPRDPYDALALAVQPDFLVGVMIANLLLLLFRLFAVADAFRCGNLDKQLSTFSWRRTMLVVVLIGTILPHTVVAYYDFVTYDAVGSVFSSSSTDIDRDQPAEVQVSREINLAPGVTAVAPAVTGDSDSVEEGQMP